MVSTANIYFGNTSGGGVSGKVFHVNQGHSAENAEVIAQLRISAAREKTLSGLVGCIFLDAAHSDPQNVPQSYFVVGEIDSPAY